MLEILEILGRSLMALLRIAAVIQFIVDVCLGSYWLISSSFRRKVTEEYDRSEILAVYFGAFLTATIIAAGTIWIISTYVLK
jgi:hypothetical protein